MPPPAAQGRRVTARTTRTTQARTPQSAGRWSRCEGVTRGPGAPLWLTCNRPRVSVGGWLSPLPEADRVSGLTEGRGEDRRRSDRAAATVDSQRRARTPWHDRAGGSARSGGASARRPVVGKRRHVAALGRWAGAEYFSCGRDPVTTKGLFALGGGVMASGCGRPRRLLATGITVRGGRQRSRRLNRQR